MPEPGLLGEVVGEPGQPLLGGLEPDHAEPQGLAVERAAEDEHVLAQLLGDVPRDPGVGGGRRGQDRDPVGKLVEKGADPAVVGPEVVAPVGDAVGLVDDEQTAGRGQPGQHLVAEPRVVEALGADQEDVDLARPDRVVGLLPLLDVGGVDGDRADAGALGRRDLVAHQGEERRDDHRRAGAAGAQERGGDEVDGRLAPAGALHDQGPAPVDGECLDRGPLVLAEGDVVAPDERAQVHLGRGPHLAAVAGGGLGRCRGGHDACLPAGAHNHRGPERVPLTYPGPF